MFLAIVIAAAVVVGVVAVGGGNTVEGFGRDLQHTGQHIQDHTHTNE